MGLVDDVKLGHLPGLCALRDTLAAALESGDAPPHARAPLARQLQAVLREIHELTPPAPEDDLVTRFRRGDYLDPVDTLAAQRQDRRARAREAAEEETVS